MAVIRCELVAPRQVESTIESLATYLGWPGGMEVRPSDAEPYGGIV
jgi:hypothetical protein